MMAITRAELAPRG